MSLVSNSRERRLPRPSRPRLPACTRKLRLTLPRRPRRSCKQNIKSSFLLSQTLRPLRGSFVRYSVSVEKMVILCGALLVTQLGVWISISRRVSFTYQNDSQFFTKRQIPPHYDYSRAVTPPRVRYRVGPQVLLVMGSKTRVPRQGSRLRDESASGSYHRQE